MKQKNLRRIYCEEGSQMRRRGGCKRALGTREGLGLAARKYDYIHNRSHSAHGGAMPARFVEKAGMGHAPYQPDRSAHKGQRFETGLSL